MDIGRNVIELLSPAKDLECVRAAIDHGADAVYMGAPRFGARRAASNSIEDIAAAASYAHFYNARLHLTLNTLLFDHEVDEAKRMAWELYEAGADVLIVQDAALLGDGMPPIELHASTQCDNSTVEKILFWQSIGIRQAVLARELSLQEIGEIGRRTTIRLEAFVHGALCVGYSGQCYLSLCDGGRSANRGECAQPCRLPYDLIGADGTVFRRKSHILSLKDNNQTENIEAMIDAGVSSFKIEGRLKDAGYVSNITLHYRRIIDEILGHRPELTRLSGGVVEAGFEPDPNKSFNRGFTTYFSNGRRRDIWQPLSPKSFGEPIGKVLSCRNGNTFIVASDTELHNGDGLCFVGKKGTTYGGLRADKVTKKSSGSANKEKQHTIEQIVETRSTKGLNEGDIIFRNHDITFNYTLQHDKTVRVIEIEMTLDYSDGRFCLSLTDTNGLTVSVEQTIASDESQSSERSADVMRRTLAKLGGTPYRARQIVITPSAASRITSTSAVNALRREAVESLTQKRITHFHLQPTERNIDTKAPYVTDTLDSYANIINREAEAFYRTHGATLREWGMERLSDFSGRCVMITRHCLLNAMGQCLKQHPESRRYLPLILRKENGQEFEARINCAQCRMEIYKK